MLTFRSLLSCWGFLKWALCCQSHHSCLLTATGSLCTKQSWSHHSHEGICGLWTDKIKFLVLSLRAGLVWSPTACYIFPGFSALLTSQSALKWRLKSQFRFFCSSPQERLPYSSPDVDFSMMLIPLPPGELVPVILSILITLCFLFGHSIFCELSKLQN